MNPTSREPQPSAEQPVGWLPRGTEQLFGPEATADHSFALLTVDVPAGQWTAALRTARDELGCTFFDWLSAVDEPGTGFRVCAHLAALPDTPGDGVRRLLVRTTVPHDAPVLPTATDVYAGASWHERETHEMFGVDFTGHPHQAPLLLPDGFEGHPLRKDFVLAARVVKAWPGAKEPGESGHGGAKRRQMLPPGVPDPNEWGPRKGQLPPPPSRAARGRAAGGEERPARRMRSASAGSASQRTGPEAAGGEPAAPRRPRRARSASEGSASQRAARAAEDPTATETGADTGAVPGTGPGDSARQGSAAHGGEDHARGPRRSEDAPWHHARPAFHDGEAEPAPPADDQAARAEGAEDDDTGGDR